MFLKAFNVLWELDFLDGADVLHIVDSTILNYILIQNLDFETYDHESLCSFHQAFDI